jgi:hypothetical protein
MYSVESLHSIFNRNKVGYWFVTDMNKRRVAVTSEALKDVQDSQKQYEDFTDALEMLADSDYVVTLRTKETASRSDMPYKFSKGDAIPARNNTPSVGSTTSRSENVFAGNNMFQMMMQMMMQQQQQQQALLMQMMNMQKDSDKTLFDEKLERFKLENAKVKGIGEHIAAAIPHIPAIIGAISGQPQPTAAIGRAKAPPPPQIDERIDERKKAMELGQRINTCFNKIAKHFPEREPIETMEIVVNALENEQVKQFMNVMIENGSI